MKNIFHFCLLNAWWTIFFIFVYWMHDAYMKCIFYRMNNTMKMNSIFFFVSLLVWIRVWKCMNAWGYEDAWMNALGLFETFFLRMHVCYLHGSTWIVHETLYENKFCEICMDVWSHRWMYQWVRPLFFSTSWEWMNDENIFFICINGCM